MNDTKETEKTAVAEAKIEDRRTYMVTFKSEPSFATEISDSWHTYEEVHPEQDPQYQALYKPEPEERYLIYSAYLWFLFCCWLGVVDEADEDNEEQPER